MVEIGATSVASPPAPESIVFGLRKLTSLMEMWLSKNIILGTTPLEVPGDELNEPADTRNGIVFNLAIMMAPGFDNGKVIVSQTLRNNATSEFGDIKTLYQKLVIPQKVVSSTLPVGAGNERGFRSRVFFPKGTTIDN